MVSILYTASVPSDRVVVSPTTGSQKPNAVHTMDVCYRPIEFRATMGSALNQYKVKREVQVLKALITKKHVKTTVRSTVTLTCCLSLL
jgi:hypothetical protein